MTSATDGIGSHAIPAPSRIQFSWNVLTARQMDVARDDDHVADSSTSLSKVSGAAFPRR
jgi:hypothetical protein